MYILCTEEPGSAVLGPGWVRAGPGPAPVRRQLYTLVRAHSLGTRAAEHAGSCAAPLHRHTPHSVDMLLCTAVYTLYLRIFSRQYELIMHQESGWRFFSDHGALEQKLI